MMEIFAAEAVVRSWREESARLLHVARRPGLDPEVTEALHHASGILLASAVNATPGAPEVMVSGLAELAEEVAAQVERDRTVGPVVDPDAVCPVPQLDGQPLECGRLGCGPEDRKGCERLAYALGATAGGPDLVGHAGDDGCEGKAL